MQLIKKFRLSSIFFGFLIYGVFKLVNPNYPFRYVLLLAITSTIIVGATMIWNDYCDREHDKKKNKFFVSLNAKFYKIYAVTIWVLSLGVILFQYTIIKNIYLTLAFILYILIGIFYSQARKYFILSIIVVTFSVASGALVPLLISGTNFIYTIHIFFIILLMIFVRELIKDISDVEYDKGYKKTLPVYFGKKFSYNLIIFILTISFILMLAFEISVWPTILSILLAIFFLSLKNLQLAKVGIDLSLILFFILAILNV